jgi:hypothetical protein
LNIGQFLFASDFISRIRSTRGKHTGMTDLTTCTTSTLTRIEFSIEVGSVSRFVLLSGQSPLLILFDLFDSLQETIDQLDCKESQKD